MMPVELEGSFPVDRPGNPVAGRPGGGGRNGSPVLDARGASGAGWARAPSADALRLGERMDWAGQYIGNSCKPWRSQEAMGDAVQLVRDIRSRLDGGAGAHVEGGDHIEQICRIVRQDDCWEAGPDRAPRLTVGSGEAFTDHMLADLERRSAARDGTGRAHVLARKRSLDERLLGVCDRHNFAIDMSRSPSLGGGDDRRLKFRGSLRGLVRRLSIGRNGEGDGSDHWEKNLLARTGELRELRREVEVALKEANDLPDSRRDTEDGEDFKPKMVESFRIMLELIDSRQKAVSDGRNRLQKRR